MTLKIKIIIFTLFLILFACKTNVSASEVIFYDDFNGSSLDPLKWDYYPNDGFIIVDSSFVKLSSIPGKNYPYIKTKNNPFQINSDFSLEIRFLYPKITPWGVGLIAGISSPPNGISYNDPINSRIFTLHADAFHETFWFRFFQENIFNSLAPRDNNIHTVKLNYIKGIYYYLFDNKEIATRISGVAPSSIFFGNPANQKSLNESTPWTEFQIDYIRITSISEPSPTPTPTPTPVIVPIVFIPGHGGSFNLNDIILNTKGGVWEATPFIDVYDNLFEALKNAGYEEANGKLAKFYYDWRQKTDETSSKLDIFIDNFLTGKPKGTKVNIIAHSYGGLVSRNYLQKYSQNHNGQNPPVEKLLTAGSPHSGVVDTYYAWEGGEILNDDPLQKLAFEIPIYLHLSKYLTKRETLRNIAPSTLDLFPTFDFIKDANGNVKPINTLAIKNEWLRGLNLSFENNPSWKNYLVLLLGKDIPTLEYLKVEEASAIDKILGNWIDGKPIANEKTNSGDNRVLLKSGKLNGVKVTEITQDHGGIVKSSEGINNILSILGINNNLNKLNAKSININEVISSLASFLLVGEGKLRIFDNLGRETGISDKENRLIVIKNPQSPPYTVQVIKTANDNYNLQIGSYNKGVFDFQEISGIFPKTGTASMQFNFDSNSGLTLIDPSGEKTLTSSKQKINALIGEINKSSIGNIRKKLLILNLQTILKLIDQELNLMQNKKYPMAGINIEKTIALLFLARKEIRNENLNWRSRLLDIVWDQGKLYGNLPNLVSSKKASDKLKEAQKLAKLAETRLINKKKDPNKEERAVSIKLSGEAISQAQKFYNEKLYNLSFIHSFTSTLLSLEASL